jgi:hypothetical protein
MFAYAEPKQAAKQATRRRRRDGGEFRQGRQEDGEGEVEIREVFEVTDFGR